MDKLAKFIGGVIAVIAILISVSAIRGVDLFGAFMEGWNAS